MLWFDPFILLFLSPCGSQRATKLMTLAAWEPPTSFTHTKGRSHEGGKNWINQQSNDLSRARCQAVERLQPIDLAGAVDFHSTKIINLDNRRPLNPFMHGMNTRCTPGSHFFFFAAKQSSPVHFLAVGCRATRLMKLFSPVSKHFAASRSSLLPGPPTHAQLRMIPGLSAHEQ